MTSDLPWQAGPGHLDLTVRLTPRGGRDALEGIAVLADGRAVLKARVAAAPEDGRANEALVRLVAGRCDVPARDVVLASGATSRVKVLRIAGDPQTLAGRLSASPQRS